MAISYPEIRKFSGLYLQQNSFNVPDGALEQADNIIISKDDKISKRRGLYQYAAPVANCKTLVNYQSEMVAINDTSVGYYTDIGSSPNETGTFTAAGGVAVDVGDYSRTIEANNNLYFTSNDGVLKLEQYDSDVFSAGIAPGLDLRGKFLKANGIFTYDSQVAYRIVFGRKDSNDNLLLGSPSDILLLANNTVVGSAYTSAGAVVTVTSVGHALVTGMAVVVSSASAATLDGTWTITVLTADTYQFTASGAPAPATGTLTYGTTRTPRLEFSIPEEIDSSTIGYFFQVYRTSQSNSGSSTPTPDFKLIDERKLTSAEISANLAYYEDVIPDILLGAELYTNPNSREGELQANERPPYAEDLEFYKGHAIYAGVTTRQYFDLDVIDTSKLASGAYVEIKIGAVTRRYVSRSGVGNTTTTATSISGTGTVTITYNSHGLLTGDTVYLSRITGSIPEGEYTVSNALANTFDITSVGNTATDLDFAGVKDATNYYIFSVDTTSNASVKLRDTARGLVRAINKDPFSLVYAHYISLITDIPGKMRVQAKGFTGQIQLAAQNSTVGEGFSPTLTATFTDNASAADDNPHIFFMSKLYEFEAVPLVNYFPVGAKNKAIMRVKALRDSIIILKEDGVFRATGDFVYNMTITPLDTTVWCIAEDSVRVINNQVVFLSNQGVCLVTESAVQIISREIEDVIQPILGKSTLAAMTHSVAYESERIYLLSTLKPTSSSATVVYVYNILNQSWTNWDTTFINGFVDNSDKLHLITESNKIIRERKLQTRVDYCGQNYGITVNTVSSDNLQANITVSGGYTPIAGDVIVKNDVFSRIISVSVSGGTFDVVFVRRSNILAADTLQIYAKYDATIKLAPFHAGQVGMGKQFSQMQIHTRNYAITALDISFAGYAFGGSKNVTWLSEDTGDGWGNEPWGFFGWGQAEAVNLAIYTKPAPVIRVYVPIYQQRNTFLQPILSHSQAGESLEIQAMTFAVRPYQERVSV